MTQRSLPDMARVSAVVPRGRAGFWQIIRDLDARGDFSIADVVRETNVSRGGVDVYFRCLIEAGFLRQVGTRPNVGTPIKTYRLTKRPSRAPRLRDDGTEVASAKENLWRAIRARRVFTTAELAFIASTPELPISHKTAMSYVVRLNAAGYFTSTGTGRGSERTYRLKPGMNTGPLPPAVLRIDAVWDRNLKKVMGDGVAKEAA